MAWAHEELARRRRIYEAAVAAWYAARDGGNIVREEDERERAAGVRWRAADAVGRAALSGFQLAKSELDHAHDRVRREAGDDSCGTCRTLEEAKARVIGDRRLPPERDEEDAA